MTTSASPAAPVSPCISVCALDEQGYCRGCLRTLPEISGWARLSSEQQWGIIHACRERRLARSPELRRERTSPRTRHRQGNQTP